MQLDLTFPDPSEAGFQIGNQRRKPNRETTMMRKDVRGGAQPEKAGLRNCWPPTTANASSCWSTTSSWRAEYCHALRAQSTVTLSGLATFRGY